MSRYTTFAERLENIGCSVAIAIVIAGAVTLFLSIWLTSIIPAFKALYP